MRECPGRGLRVGRAPREERGVVPGPVQATGGSSQRTLPAPALTWSSESWAEYTGTEAVVFTPVPAVILDLHTAQ